MTITQIGIDIGKNTFHVIGLDAGNAIALRRQFSRSGLLRFFAEKMSEPPWAIPVSMIRSGRVDQMISCTAIRSWGH